MSRRSENAAINRDAETPRDRLLGKSTAAAMVHGSIALPGCLVHAGLSVSTLEWICHVLRPARSHFEGFHANLRVQTFDDIDICMKIAATALTMSLITVIGLRELVVNAVEHGNLEISCYEKPNYSPAANGRRRSNAVWVTRKCAIAFQRSSFALTANPTPSK